MIPRALLVIAAVAIAALALWAWERRPLTVSGLTPGLTVVTAAGCRLCPLAIAATAGSTVPVAVVDIGDLSDRSIRSVPTAMVVDADGWLVASRSGRAAVTDMGALIAMAESLA